MRKQIIDLEDQICKYKSLIQDLSDKKNELNSQKTAIRCTLQLLCNEPLTDESDIPVTRMLPNTNITRNQQIAQNPRKQVASDLIEQTSDLSENHTEVNIDISAKNTRYSNSTSENDIPINKYYKKSANRTESKKKTCL